MASQAIEGKITLYILEVEHVCLPSLSSGALCKLKWAGKGGQLYVENRYFLPIPPSRNMTLCFWPKTFLGTLQHSEIHFSLFLTRLKLPVK